jgi:hypothetical protein
LHRRRALGRERRGRGRRCRKRMGRGGGKMVDKGKSRRKKVEKGKVRKDIIKLIFLRQNIKHKKTLFFL